MKVRRVLKQISVFALIGTILATDITPAYAATSVAGVNETQDVSKDESAECEVYAELSSIFRVIIPKKITLSGSTGEKITLTYNNSEVPEENYSILQAKINDYAIDNGLTTNLTAYLPIPIAKPGYNYISGATRVVYDSNGNTATYSRNPYELYNLTNKIENTSWDIISNSTNDTF